MEKENAYILLDWNSAQICWIPEAKQCRQECQSSSQTEIKHKTSANFTGGHSDPPTTAVCVCVCVCVMCNFYYLT